jgi:hypothetical protein
MKRLSVLLACRLLHHKPYPSFYFRRWCRSTAFRGNNNHICIRVQVAKDKDTPPLDAFEWDDRECGRENRARWRASVIVVDVVLRFQLRQLLFSSCQLRLGRRRVLFCGHVVQHHDIALLQMEPV